MNFENRLKFGDDTDTCVCVCSVWTVDVQRLVADRRRRLSSRLPRQSSHVILPRRHRPA